MTNPSEIKGDTFNIPKDLLVFIPDYVSRRHVDVTELKRSLEAKDFQMMREIGHKLKGHGRSYGFERISSIGHLVVEACDSNSQELALRAINLLDQELARIDAYLALSRQPQL